MRRLVEHEGYRAVLSVPILTQGAPFGCLATYWWEPHEPTAAEVQTLTSLATLAAVAIENARLYDATRRQVERLERLSHVNRAVSASLRLDDVLDEITRAAGTLCDAPLATTWLADETERVLVRRAFHGAQEIRDAASRSAWRSGRVASGVVAERREARLNVRVEGNPEIVAREALLAHGVRTFSGLPVMLGDRLLGVLAVSGREGRPLGEADEALLQALVGQAAVAIQNARLYEDARAHEIEARRALDELRRTQEQLVRMEKLRALGEMASGVAHDFNNVLAVILGRVQLLQRKLEDPTFRRWLGDRRAGGARRRPDGPPDPGVHAGPARPADPDRRREPGDSRCRRDDAGAMAGRAPVAAACRSASRWTSAACRRSTGSPPSSARS